MSFEHLQGTVLDKIIKEKLVWIDSRKQLQPLSDFKDLLSDSDRDFYQALNKSSQINPEPALILECKKASPSKGLIREDFDLDEICDAYERYASAISVLTDEAFFHGRFEYLLDIHKKVSQPLLCKEFFIDPYQVYLARYYQADAILLMLSLLDDATYTTLSEIAYKLNMDVLTEVSNEEECYRAKYLNAKIIGINNRNLRDLTIDLNKTEQLSSQFSSDLLLISESGITTHAHYAHLSQYVNGFLIGSHLMSQDNISRAILSLKYGCFKVCGLTRLEDLALSYNLGASYAGFIFAIGSARYIELQKAKQLIDTFKNSCIDSANIDLKFVGVFQNQPIEYILTHVTELSLNVVQLHGDEDDLFIKRLRDQIISLGFSEIEIWKSYAVMINQETLPELSKTPDKIVLDTSVKINGGSDNQSGGTGQQFDWRLIEKLSDELKKRVILAGGIKKKNINKAKSYHCFALDINSGIEIAPGIKSKEMLLNLLEEIIN